MFPVLDRGGRVVAFSGRVLPVSEEIPEGVLPPDAGKYVNSPETPLYKKGELLYGLSNARMTMRQKAEAVLVEGNFDVVQMHQHGFTNTAAPLGTSFTEGQARLLRRFAETVWLVFDGDDAGRKAARTAQPVCAKAGLIARVGVLPPKSDPDSYLRSLVADQGPAGMQRVLDEGQSVVEWLIHDASAHAGDPVPERVAALRSVASVIAGVPDAIERNVYVKLVAQQLHIDEAQVRIALREHTDEVRRSAREGLYQDDARRRPALTSPDDETIDPVQVRRMAVASAIEALLLYPEFLEGPEALELQSMVDDRLGPMLAELRRQWGENRRIEGTAVLESCPDDKIRHWVAARLVANPTEGDDPKLREKSAETLRDDLLTLKRLVSIDKAKAMKSQSARAGVQGDPGGEHQILNDQLELKRQIARLRSVRGGRK